jgi:membrane protease YdiL (CAAX protease family)
MTISYQLDNPTRRDTSRRVLWETLIALALTIIPSLLWPGYKIVSVLPPMLYLFIERRIRHRAWAELGFDLQGIRSSLAANWSLILLVALAIQAAVFLLASAFWPAFLSHIVSRIPLFDSTQPVLLLGMLLLATLGEEIVFRSLFQERLGWFIKTPIAIVVVSLLFGLMHTSQGSPAMVAVDVALVTVDSILFGLIFARGKNLYVAWLAHLLADIAGIALLSLV